MCYLCGICELLLCDVICKIVIGLCVLMFLMYYGVFDLIDESVDYYVGYMFESMLCILFE